MNIVEIYKKFPTETDCILHLEQVRWNGKPVCPYCQSTTVSSVPKENRHHCNQCNTSFSVLVGTIFQATKLDLQLWFLAISLILAAKKGISSRQLGRHLGVTKDTAWRMAMQIRDAMPHYGQLLEGIVEVDETYIGGKPRKEGKRKDENGNEIKNKRGRGTKKIPVVGVVERDGNIYAQVVENVTSESLNEILKEKVDIEQAIIISDEFRGYCDVKSYAKHETINHSVEYAKGHIHTNTIEGFWGLFKRGIIGQYHRISLKYLNKYIREFCYRFNNRNNKSLFELTIINAVSSPIPF